MKQISVLVFAAGLFFFSCGNAETKTGDAPEKKQHQPYSFHFTDLKIDSAYFYAKSALCNPLDTLKWAGLGVTKISSDPGYGPYKIFDTLLRNDSATIIALARDAENEKFVWLVRYDAHGKYAQHQLVYYEDFVEYYTNTHSRISSDTVYIVQHSDFGEGETKNEIKISLQKNYGWK